MQFLRFSGTLMPDNRFVRRSSFLTTQVRHSHNNEKSPIQFEWRRKETSLLRWGATLLSRDHAVYSGQIPARTPLRVLAVIPFPEEADQLIARSGDAVLFAMDVPRTSPRFDPDPKVSKEGELGIIEWQATHDDEITMQFAVRTSPDGGKRWTRLASRLKRPPFRFQWNRLSGGLDCIVEIAANDGLHVACARVPIKNAPPDSLEVMIVQPSAVHTLLPPLKLEAFVQLSGARPVADSDVEFIWTADQQIVARGRRAAWSEAAAGKFELAVSAKLGALAAQASRTIVVARAGAEEPASERTEEQ